MSFYSYKDPETLTHEDLDDAIVEYLDDNEPEEWERKVTFTRYEHRVISDARKKSLAEGVLESFLELLDEDYGDPESSTTPTAAMEAAAAELVTAVTAGYKVWACSREESIVVDILDWLKEHKQESSRIGFQERLETALARMEAEESDGS